MRLRIQHRISHEFASPARGVIQVLRLTPRSFESQHVLSWRLNVNQDCALHHSQDTLGNVVNTFTLPGPLDEVTVTAEGEIEINDAAGIVRGTIEPLPPDVFLRASPATEANGVIREFATDATRGADNVLDKLHALLLAVHEAIEPADAESGDAPASAAFALKRGAPRDFAHIFIAGARVLDAPARFVSGYVVDAERPEGQSHCWAEAHVPKLGWIGFDATIGECVGEGHARVAVGIDWLGASPVRAARGSGGAETVTSHVALSTAMQAAWQSQS
jgi:transglutaminase-like putative cysteine protease